MEQLEPKSKLLMKDESETVTHMEVVIDDDVFVTEESTHGACHDLRNDSGSLLFKKVNVQKHNIRGEGGRGESGENPCDSPLARGQGGGRGSLFSANSAAGDKRKVSFNDVQVKEEEGSRANDQGAGSVGGAELRRLLYRHRETISKMLHDGEHHEVWRPGMKCTRRIDSEVNREILACIYTTSSIVIYSRS